MEIVDAKILSNLKNYFHYFNMNKKVNSKLLILIFMLLLDQFIKHP